ncbi:DUF1691-domain-containing protein [Thozetella sp. PMI_491]|nr:DUF1691-domain-containing protein [Thozetella sp. PMI_491]
MDSASLRSRASQDTFISLMQLDPSPMDSPNADGADIEKELPPLPEESETDASSSKLTDRSVPLASSGTTSVGLSGSGGHGPIFYLMRIQRYSSYTLSLFTTLHLATTSIIPLVARSVPASESYLLLAREIYQTPLSEPLLVGLPLIAHVGSGIALRLLRRSQNLKRYGGATPGVYALHHAKTSASGRSSGSAVSVWPHLSYISVSGYGFAVLLGAHVFMNRGLPLSVEGDSANIGLAYVAHGFARHPAVSWLAYSGLLAVGCGHMVWGWAKWLGVAQKAGWKVEWPTGNAALDKKNRKRRRRILLAVNAVSAAAAAVWAAGGLGIVARGGLQPGWVGKIYDGLYDKIPLL